MLSLLIRILLFLLTIWLLKRFLGLILSAPRSGKTGKSVPGDTQKMVKDPVCGMYMDPRLAIPVEKKGELLYFCSEECKKKYLGSNAGLASASPRAN